MHYQNLSGAPSAYHLYGLGTADQAGGVKSALLPSVVLTAASGQFAGQSPVDQATAAGLVGGQTDFNLHPGAPTGGEIRGQLLP